MFHLFPNFGTRGAFMRSRIRRIAELIHIKSTGNFFGKFRRHILIVFRMPARHIRARQSHLSTERAHMRDFFLRHLVGNNKNDAITLRSGD